MFLIAAAALSAFGPPATPQGRVGASIQAVATIRIIEGARLSFRGRNGPEVPHPRNCIINSREGHLLPARLIEFE